MWDDAVYLHYSHSPIPTQILSLSHTYASKQDCCKCKYHPLSLLPSYETSHLKRAASAEDQHTRASICKSDCCCLLTWILLGTHQLLEYFPRTRMQIYLKHDNPEPRERVCFIFAPLTSVTRWLDYLLNIWPFTIIKNCPKAQHISQSRFNILTHNKWTLKKGPKDF